MSLEQNAEYKPDFCDKVIAMGRAGKTVAQFCKKYQIIPKQLYMWTARHPEFGDALQYAKICAQAVWEERIEELIATNGNATLIKAYMSNVHGWTDKQQHHIHTTNDESTRTLLDADTQYITQEY